MNPLTLFDIIALAVCIFVLLVYHVHFYYTTTFQLNSKMQLSFKFRNIAHWLHKHKEKSDPQSMTLAIHTLRNTMMVGVFVGGYALTIAYSSAASYKKNTNKRLQVRGIMLAVLLFASFLCWANAIRCASHLGYLIGTLEYVDTSDLQVLERISPAVNSGHSGSQLEANVSDEAVAPNDSESVAESKNTEYSDRTRQRVQHYEYDKKVVLKRCEYLLQSLMLNCSLGFRLLFVSIPFAFFVYGPLGLVIATGAILIFSYNYDYQSFGPFKDGMS